jgi:hypothetical protein
MEKNDLASLLRDFAQATSNSVASNAAVPVDVLAWLLRKGGVNVPPNPVMGSDWLAEKGFTREVKNKGAGLAGDIAGMVLPFAGVTKAPQIAKGLLGMGENLATPNAMKNASQRGAVVWHGSPHKFDAFDSSKIGTGEGAQAYGHGLYLAENPTIAKTYQSKVSAMKNSGGPTISGVPINWDDPAQTAAFELSRHNGDRSAAADFYERTFKASEIPAILRSNKPLPSVDLPGNLYKVDLPDEHIAKMLDWDKPLSQQAPDVRSILERLPQSQQVFTTRAAPKNGMTEIVSPSGDGMGYYHPSEVSDALKDLSSGFFKKIGGKELTAEDIYSRLSNASTKTGVDNKFGISLNGQPAASEFLRQQGIPGIKYLDGGSRGAGQGSSNYVIFPQNERLLRILERNGESVAPNFAYPQSEALKLAQQRAALPKSEGGLGLRADNTAMERADVMFPTDAYHGTNSDIHAFDPLLSDTRRKTGTPNGAIVSSTNPKTASTYAGEVTDDYGNIINYKDGGNVIPLRINTGNGLSVNAKGANWGDIFTTKYPDAETTNDIAQIALDKGKQSATIKKVLDNATWSKQNGVDSRIGDTIFSFNPDDIRSRFAAFDPWRRNAAIAATMGVAAPDLLANPLDENNNRLIDILRNK